MSQWFSGGPLTPSSPAQAASRILEEGVLQYHEGNYESDFSESNPSEACVNKARYTNAHPLIHTTPTETVCHVCFFPSGVHRGFFKCYRLYHHSFLPEHGVIAFVFSKSRNEEINKPHIQVYENDTKLGGAKLEEKVYCIGVESRDRIAVGHEGHVDIYDRQKKRYVKTEEIRMAGHLPQALNFSGEVLLVGTKLGGVFGYNMRKGLFSWTFQAEGRGRVHDVRMKKGIVYVCGTGGLWMWDMRGTNKVRRQFVGHRNRGKRIMFDTNSELGLLAAGGDDGVVRIWNCRNGEEPMGDLKLPGEIPVSVRFVRDTFDGEESLGMWIGTKRNLYTCKVESNELC